jgi:Trypsin-co-occurring domain 2
MGDMMGNGSTGPDDALDLADAITLLRDQVAEAQYRISADGDAGVRFALGEITLELGLELARTRGLDGGLRFSVVGLGGKRESTRTTTHTLTVRLNPHLPGGVAGDVDVSDQDDA